MTSDDGRVVEATDVPSLKCSHEEADTRLLLHATHAERCGYESIVIQSPDIDVAVIACTLSCHFKASLYFRTGTKARTRIVDISAIRKDLGDDLADCLIGLHALTGCDSTSAFKRRGQKTAYSVLNKNINDIKYKDIARLGVQFQVTDDLFTACETFVCRLYGSDCISVDECRYQLFSLRCASGENLPPTADALRKHVQRANYQAAIWFRALDSDPDVPSPCGNGWKIYKEELTVDWMETTLHQKKYFIVSAKVVVSQLGVPAFVQ